MKVTNPSPRIGPLGRASRWLACWALCAASACDANGADPARVHYQSAPAIGAWTSDPEPAAGAAGGVAAEPVAPSSPAGGSAGSAGIGSSAQGMAGASGAPAAGVNGGAASAGGGAGTAPDVLEPSAAGAGSAGGADSAAVTPEPATGSLRFAVLTKTLNGKYSPKNIGAIWIEDESGAFVKTLEVWAEKRARYLSRWRLATASNRVDAVSSATLRSHINHTATWNLTDVNRKPVAPGNYTLVIEITDHDGDGDSTEVPFTLGGPLALSPANTPHFVDMALTVE